MRASKHEWGGELHGKRTNIGPGRAFNVMSPKGNAFLAGILNGKDARESARDAKLSENMALRWLGAPEFRKAFYDELRGPMYVQAARLAKILPGAISRLAQLAASAKDERVAVKASIALVDFGTKMMESIPELKGIGAGAVAPMFVLPNGAKIAVAVQVPDAPSDEKKPPAPLNFKIRSEELEEEEEKNDRKEVTQGT